MHRFLSAVMMLALLSAAGCLDDPFSDYYPHHEIEPTRSDEIKSGPDWYGGHDHHTPIIIPGAGSATNPSSTAPTTSSGLP
jgi:hypothetical protein